MRTEPTVSLELDRPVRLVPRDDGLPWSGRVRSWTDTDGQVCVTVAAEIAAVGQLDRHVVWLTTLPANPSDVGVSVFAAEAIALDRQVIELRDVVKVADEPRRRDIRASGCTVSLPAHGGPQRVVKAYDVSRGGLRVPSAVAGWTYRDPIEVVVYLPDQQPIDVLCWKQRFDAATRSVVLRFADLSVAHAGALDRYAFAQLPDAPG